MPSAPPSKICRPAIVTGAVTGQSSSVIRRRNGGPPGSIRYTVPARVARYKVSPNAAGAPSTGASTLNDQLRRRFSGRIETTCESVVPPTRASSWVSQGETTAPGEAARCVTLPSFAFNRNSESVVAISTAASPARAAGIRPTPSRRRHRIFPFWGCSPITSPRWVWAISIPATSASGAPTAGVEVRQICLPFERRSA